MWQRWHRLLIFLRIRNRVDWASPGLGPEVNHPYVPHATLRCCEHCGAGKLNPIHQEPYDPRRAAEVLGNPPYPMQGRAHYPGEPAPNPANPAAVKAYVEREH